MWKMSFKGAHFWPSIRRRAAAVEEKGLRRRLQKVIPISPGVVEVEGERLINAASNDYLGLSLHPLVLSAAQGGGAGSSRLITGTRPLHLELEAALEELFGRPALLFPTGYQANLAVFTTLATEQSVVASDALNHASIIDGLRLSAAKRVIVRHCDPSKIADDVDIIALEGLYSMDGDIPDFKSYPADRCLVVDEAHAFGTMGPRGKGAAASRGVIPDVIVGTMSKAIGSAGGFVVGPQELKELLVSTGRSFVYTTAAPEPVVAMSLAGLKLATGDAGLREKLADNTSRLRSGLRQVGWVPLGDAHVVPFLTRAPLTLATELRHKGVLVGGIRYPTVARSAERIRLSVSAAHTTDQIDQIISAFEQLVGFEEGLCEAERS